MFAIFFDFIQKNRITFLLESFDRFLHAQKVTLESMLLDVSVEPLNLTSHNHKELPVPSSTPSIFLSPRRRAQSDDGPAIGETRALNLPDHIAVLRDNMKSLIGRQSARLKALKLVSAFNEGVALAVETFSVSLQARLDNEGYAGKM